MNILTIVLYVIVLTGMLTFMLSIFMFVWKTDILSIKDIIKDLKDALNEEDYVAVSLILMAGSLSLFMISLILCAMLSLL